MSKRGKLLPFLVKIVGNTTLIATSAFCAERSFETKRKSYD